MSSGGASDRGVLLLASRSARRREMLRDAGVVHTWAHPGVDDGELPPGTGGAAAFVAGLSYLKARAGAEVARTMNPVPWVVLGADTTCERDGRILGTPRNEAEALSTVLALAHGAHRVLTGVTLLEPLRGNRLVCVSVSVVTVGVIAPGAAQQYVRTGEWRGKAGAYNLSERQEAGWPLSYVGEASGIMGLPLGLLRRMLGVARRWAQG